MKDAIENALRSVEDVHGDGDIVSNHRVQKILVDDGMVTLSLSLPTDEAEVRKRIEDRSREAIRALDGVREVMIMTRASKPSLAAAGSPPPRPAGGPGPAPGGDPFADRAPIEGVKHIIAVSSAKGGVGKSTVCVNVALALVRDGARVGLMDADVYGPSAHLLLGIRERPRPGTTKEVAPVETAGLKVMSLGLLTDRGTPVIWRGPIVMGVVKKFLQEVEWGELDYLMIDMPPGTGDAQLTLVQTVPLSGAIIVTTPSELALVDAEKGLQMFREVNVPVLGMVENMSYFACPHCGERSEIFDHGGGRSTADRLGTPFLGELPLDPVVRSSGDEGEPIVLRDPDCASSRIFADVAAKLREACPSGEGDS